MSTSQDKHWSRGYFCAVAKLAEIEGTNSHVVELFRAGGDWTLADAEDIATFKTTGLVKPALNSHGDW